MLFLCEDPEENGCDPVQVIQDRLCVSWLAYSWLLALDGSRWAKREEGILKLWVKMMSFREGGKLKIFHNARNE